MTNYRISSGFFGDWDWQKEWNDLWDMVAPLSVLPATLLSNHFPPCNYYADEDGTLHFDFAVAGYTQDEVDLKFEDDHLVLTLTPNGDESKKGKVFQKAIKKANSVTRALVPFTKYDVAKATASFKDGMLKVTIPVKEDAKPVSVKIDIN